MAENLKNRILTASQKLGEALVANDFKDAYTIAGELSSLLKSEEPVGLNLSQISDLNALLENYYRVNQDMQEHTRKMYGIGKSLLDIK